MSVQYVQHKKIALRADPILNEARLHDRIYDHLAILGIGEGHVLDRQRDKNGVRNRFQAEKVPDTVLTLFLGVSGGGDRRRRP